MRWARPRARNPIGWKFSDFVEEKRPPFANSNRPGAAESRRKGALLMANNSDAIRSRGIAAQFTPTNGREDPT